MIAAMSERSRPTTETRKRIGAEWSFAACAENGADEFLKKEKTAAASATEQPIAISRDATVFLLSAFGGRYAFAAIVLTR